MSAKPLDKIKTINISLLAAQIINRKLHGLHVVNDGYHVAKHNNMPCFFCCGELGLARSNALKHLPL